VESHPHTHLHHVTRLASTGSANCCCHEVRYHVAGRNKRKHKLSDLMEAYHACRNKTKYVQQLPAVQLLVKHVKDVL
jgi:hypothetical protein